MTGRRAPSRRAVDRLLALLACLAGLAGPATAALHGVAHAREHAAAIDAPTAMLPASATAGTHHHAIARVAAPDGAHAALADAAHTAHRPASPALEVGQHDGDAHLALHTRTVGAPRLDVAVALPARASPATPSAVTPVREPAPVGIGPRAPPAPARYRAQPRGPPVG